MRRAFVYKVSNDYVFQLRYGAIVRAEDERESNAGERERARQRKAPASAVA